MYLIYFQIHIRFIIWAGTNTYPLKKPENSNSNNKIPEEIHKMFC